jgi:hypothetical protein
VAAPKSRHIPELSNKARPRMRVENDSFGTNFPYDKNYSWG